jgi:hypothetical protein
LGEVNRQKIEAFKKRTKNMSLFNVVNKINLGLEKSYQTKEIPKELGGSSHLKANFLKSTI